MASGKMCAAFLRDLQKRGKSELLGPLAQLVEQGTFNPKVVGSTPTRPIPSNSGETFARALPHPRDGCLQLASLAAFAIRQSQHQGQHDIDGQQRAGLQVFLETRFEPLRHQVIVRNISGQGDNTTAQK